jgi:hypothetical protein
MAAVSERISMVWAVIRSVVCEWYMLVVLIHELKLITLGLLQVLMRLASERILVFAMAGIFFAGPLFCCMAFQLPELVTIAWRESVTIVVYRVAINAALISRMGVCCSKRGCFFVPVISTHTLTVVV